MDEKATIPATPSLETPMPSKEEPLVELLWKKWCYYFAILIIIGTTWSSIFGAIIPYLTTDDFNEIWPAHVNNATETSEKMVLFVVSWIWLPCLPFLAGAFRMGVISFYETYVEQRPYLPFFKKITIPYKAMHVMERNSGLRLTNGNVQPWLGNQFKYWKTLCWEGIGISVIDMVYSNPECHPKAIELARERAVKIDRS
jgi:hypothetical protein